MSSSEEDKIHVHPGGVVDDHHDPVEDEKSYEMATIGGSVESDEDFVIVSEEEPGHIYVTVIHPEDPSQVADIKPEIEDTHGKEGTQTDITERDEELELEYSTDNLQRSVEEQHDVTADVERAVDNEGDTECLLSVTSVESGDISEEGHEGDEELELEDSTDTTPLLQRFVDEQHGVMADVERTVDNEGDTECLLSVTSVEPGDISKEERTQENEECMVNDDVKKYIDTTMENHFKSELQNVLCEISKTTEIKMEDYKERNAQATTNASLDLKRYIEWEITNAVSDLKLELKRLVETETMNNVKAFAETSKELKRCVETETENTVNTFKDQSQQICQTFTEVSSELKKCIECSQVGGKHVSKSEHSELVIVYAHEEKISPSRGNLLTTIETLGKEYHVHFSFTPGSSSTGCRNIFHMSGNGNNQQYGDSIPSVNFLSAKQCFSIISAVNGEPNHKQSTILSLPAENTYVIDIIQQHNEGKYYTYKIYLNDILMYAVLNYDAREFNMVKVFVSDPWNNEQVGVMENLIIKTKVELNRGGDRLGN